MFLNHTVSKIMLFLTVLQSSVLSFSAATDSNKGILQYAFKQVKSHSITAVSASVLGGYVLADYFDTLPSWMPSLGDCKKYCKTRPLDAALLGGIFAGSAMALYYLIEAWKIGNNRAAIKSCVDRINSIRDRQEELRDRSEELEHKYAMIQSYASRLGSISHASKSAQSSKFVKWLTEQEQLEIRTFLGSFVSGHYYENPRKIPDLVKERCLSYVDVIPEYLHKTVFEAARQLGIESPIFFHTKSGNSSASQDDFDRIGLSAALVISMDPIYSEELIPMLAENRKEFYCTLYHELCHIKGNHSKNHFNILVGRILKWLQAHLEGYWKPTTNSHGWEVAVQETRCPSAKPQSCEMCNKIKILHMLKLKHSLDFVRHQEMEAELGAMYYLWKLQGINKMSEERRGKEDEKHPTNEDQYRYNQILWKRLQDNPEADYSIVEGLAKEYLIERDSRFTVLFEENVPPQLRASSSSSGL